MAVDFFCTNDPNNHNLAFSLKENDLLILEKSLTTLKRLTGIKIDAYCKIKMHPDYVKLLLRLLEDDSASSHVPPDTKTFNVTHLKEYLRKIIQTNTGLTIVGD